MANLAPNPIGQRILEFTNKYDAFSNKMVKQNAYAIIYKEVCSIQTSIMALEQQISQYRRLIISWKSHHNSLSDISRLPDDVLVEIWKHLAHNVDNDMSTRWLSVTHVCSRWRQVALRCPVLWSWPCLRRPDLLAAMLERARSAKLTLVFDLVAISKVAVQYFSHVSALVSSALPNVQAIILKCTPNSDSAHSMMRLLPAAQVFQPLALEKATNLEYLKVSYTQFGIRFAPYHSPYLLRLIRSSPCIRKITFEGQTLCSLGISPNTFRTQLLHLHVSLEESVLGLPSDSVATVITALKHMPNLQSLILEGVFRCLRADEISWCRDHLQPISFENLKSLELVASAQSCNLFLNLITYPSTTFVDLKGLWDDQADSFSFTDAVKRVLATCTNRMAPSINFLSIDEDDGELVLVFEHRDDDTSTRASLELRMPPSFEIIPELTRTCPLKDLLFLEYGLLTSVMATWKSFGILENINVIYFSNSSLLTHPTLLKVFSLIQFSSDTVFDPWPESRTLLGDSQSATTPTLSFYYPHLGEVLARTPRRPDLLKAGEEFARIASARTSLTSTLGRMAE